MAKQKKKFGETTVGKLLKQAVGLINPTLGKLVTQSATPEQVIQEIARAPVPPEDKIKARELVLQAYEAEVSDRIAARQREAQIASAGGSDILFKTVGWGITLCFIAVVGAAIFNWIPEDNQRLFDMAFGAVVAAFTQVIGYYFGSSLGSKQKSQLLGNGA